jgi:stringent starvation protein B
MDGNAVASTRPYLIRALYEWCTDNAFTPFIAVHADDSVRVPNEYIKDGEIVLNISFDATSALKLGNEYIEFKGRFGGVARDILIPVNRVLAIYARENGQGMAFPLLSNVAEDGEEPAAAPGGLSGGAHVDYAEESPSPRPPSGSRPTLTRVK